MNPVKGCWLLASADNDGLAPALTIHTLSEEQARQVVEIFLNILPKALRHTLILVELDRGTCWCDVNDAKVLDGKEAIRLDGRALMDPLIKGRAAGIAGEAHLFSERVLLRFGGPPRQSATQPEKT